MPKELGGGGCTTLQQVLVQEQMGRVTNALGWVAATPPSWLPPVATPDQVQRYLKPAIRGEREECYAITEEGAGSDVDAIEATARRDGDEWVLNGVKWHVTSYNTADYCFFQAKTADGEHLMFLVDLPVPGVSVLRTPPTRTRSATSTRSSASPTSRPRRQPGRRRGRRHVLRA